MTSAPDKTTPIQPLFLGGTLAEHETFVLVSCRYEHINVPMTLFHYVTWSVGHVAFYVMAERLVGSTPGFVWAVLLGVWAARMDLRVGALFGLMEVAYAFIASGVLARSEVAHASTGATVAIAFATLVVAFLTEVASHLVAQKLPPGPPSNAVFPLPKKQLPLLGVYFALVFGLFFLTLDLSMRFFGYRSRDHRRVSEIASEWHRRAAAAAADNSRKREWHLRAIAGDGENT